MTSPLVLRCQFRGGQRSIIDGLSMSSSILDLKEKIFLKTSVPIQRQKILCGFPPKELDLTKADIPLSMTGIRSGDTLIVEEDRLMPRVIDNFVGLCSNSEEGKMVRRTVPADNSCLFTSLSILLFDGDYSSANVLRNIVATTILENPSYYNEALLGKPVSEYCTWIQDESHWGGAIEITALSTYFQVQIDVVDVQSGRIDQFGQDKGFTKRIFLIYDGIHYDPLIKVMETTTQRVFSIHNDAVLTEALEVAADAQKKRQFTDLGQFSLRCITCNTGLRGQSDATAHAVATGHTNFGEV